MTGPSIETDSFETMLPARLAVSRGNRRVLAEEELGVGTDQEGAGVHGDQCVRRFGDGELRKPRGNVDDLAIGDIEGIDADLATTPEFVEDGESDRTVVGWDELQVANAQLVDVDVERVERHVEFVCERNKLEGRERRRKHFERTDIEGK